VFRTFPVQNAASRSGMAFRSGMAKTHSPSLRSTTSIYSTVKRLVPGKDLSFVREFSVKQYRAKLTLWKTKIKESAARVSKKGKAFASRHTPNLPPRLLSPKVKLRFFSLKRTYSQSRSRIALQAQQITKRGYMFRDRVLAGIASRRRRLSSSMKARKEDLRKFKAQVISRSKNAGKGIMSLWKTYGWVGIGCYATIYVSSLASLFIVVRNGGITSQGLIRTLDTLHMKDLVDVTKIENVNSVWGQFMMAWVMTKVIEPLRAVLAVAITPTVAKFFTKRRFARGIR